MAEKSVADVLKEAEKKYGLRVDTLTSIAEDVKAYSTGNLAIDFITGVGGLPVGRSIELFGAPSCGKTTTALQCAAALQKVIISGGNDDPNKGPLVSPSDRIVYFDYEHAIDLEYCKALGLDINHSSFLFAQPESLEQGANVAKALIETGQVRLIIWDSVAGAVPSSKAEAEIGKSLPAVAAKLYADFASSLNEILHRNNCSILWLNQIRELMQMGYARPGMPPVVTTPGGVALKFYASVRLEYKPMGTVKVKIIDPLTKEEIEQVQATNVKVKVVKNKVGPPFRQAVVRVRFGKGFDNFWTALQILVAHKKIVFGAGGYWYFEKSPDLIHPDMDRQATGNKRPYIRGEKIIFEFADARPDWRSLVIAAADRVVREDINVLSLVTPDTGEDDDEQVAEVETATGTAHVNMATGLIETGLIETGPIETAELIDPAGLIDPGELDRLTAFIPKTEFDEPKLKEPIKPVRVSAAKPAVAKPVETSSFTDDLLADL